MLAEFLLSFIAFLLLIIVSENINKARGYTDEQNEIKWH